MSRPANPDFNLLRAFEEGRAALVFCEVRCSTRRDWTPIAELHKQEVADIPRLRNLVPHDARNVHIAIEPQSGRLGVFVVADDEPQLDLNNGGVSPVDPGAQAEEVAGLIGARMSSALRVAGEVLARLAAGAELSYEDVFGDLPPDVPPESLRAALCQGHLPSVDISVANEMSTLGGRNYATRELVSNQPIELVVDVRQINRDGKPNGTVRLNVVSAIDPSKRLPGDLALGRSFDAQLRTADNQRALALLHLPGAYELNVRVKVSVSFNLSNGRMTIVIEDVDADDLARQMRPVQAELLDHGP